jgi:iron(III) transport system permease protein
MSGALANRTVWWWLSLATLIVMVVFLLYPLLNILTGSLGSGGRNGWAQLLADSRYPEAIGNTLLLSSAVTVLSVLIGVPLAYLSSRYTFPGKAALALLPLVTLVIPEVIAAQTWLMLVGNNGIVTRTLRSVDIALPSFYGWNGLIVSMTFTYYAYVYISTLAAIRGFDVQLEEAAQSLGTSPIRSRLKVLVPVILPSVMAGALLVFTMVMGNFGTSSILGGQVRLLSVMTYQAAVAEGGSDPVMQSTLASVAVGLIVIVLFVQRWILSRGRYQVTQGRSARPVPLAGGQALLLGGAAGLLVLVSLMPLGMLLVGAFTTARGPVMRWGEWTLANIERLVLTNPMPIINTLIYAGTATLIGIAFSTLVSYMIVKKRNLFTPALDYLSTLPLALSGTAIGIGLVVSFNSGWLQLTGTGAIIVLAYAIRRLPFAMRNASSTLYNIPDSIEEASISLGVPPVPSFFKVVLPLMLPAIASAMVLTWAVTVSELSASIIVYSGGRETMPIQIYKLIDSNLMAAASAMGVLLLAVILIPIVVATRIFRVEIFSSA